MAHPYQEHASSQLWAAIDSELRDLEANQDLTLTTAREYVIGALCARLIAEGFVVKRRTDAPAP
jgi:hypothetical protein